MTPQTRQQIDELREYIKNKRPVRVDGWPHDDWLIAWGDYLGIVVDSMGEILANIEQDDAPQEKGEGR